MGKYLVSGEAESFSGATVTVSAIRRFTQDTAKTAPSYALLDRQFTSVSDGEWQAELQIWQTEGLASPQELWQIDQATLNMALTPTPEVEFAATLDPIEARKWPQAIAQAEASSAASYTVDGDVYLAAQSTIGIPVPASLAKDALKSAAIARRISDRKVTTIDPGVSAVSDSEQSAAANRTTLPISPRQYLR